MRTTPLLPLLALLACGEKDNTPVDSGVLDCSNPFTLHVDADGDGYGDPDATEQACGLGEGLVADANDCDDDDADVHPGAAELCDGVDNDCDGELDVDAEGAATWYRDLDGDGYGDDEVTEPACEAPDGYVEQGGDCDDLNVAAYPGAPEYCDGVYTDCAQPWAQDSGLVTFWPAEGGDPQDWSDSFAAGTRANPIDMTFADEGELAICGGPFYVTLRVETTLTMGTPEPLPPAVLSGAAQDRVLSASTPFAELSLSRLVLRDGVAHDEISPYGGGLRCEALATVDVDTVWFTSNAADYGGGLYLASTCEATLHDLRFEGNVAAEAGGGLYAAGTQSLSVDTLSFTGNLASLGGGAALVGVDGLSWVGGSFLDNQAEAGGALFMDDSSATLEGHSFIGNESTDQGGGAHLSRGSLEGVDLHFEDNRSHVGGGLYVASGNATLSECSFTNNVADEQGGGVEIFIGGLTGDALLFTGNEASFGGGLYGHFADLVLGDSTWQGNQASELGGGVAVLSTDLAFTDAELDGNEAPQGGGLSTSYSNVEADGIDLLNNVAQEGAGLYLSGGSAELRRATFTDNSFDDAFVDDVNESYTFSGTGTVSCDAEGCSD